MEKPNYLFNALEINNKSLLKKFSQKTKISEKNLKYYNENNLLPSGKDLEEIISASDISKTELMLHMGILDRTLLKAIRQNASDVFKIVEKSLCKETPEENIPPLVFETELGQLYRGDCLNLMRQLPSDSVDLAFADPPFNLKKLYPSKINDNLKENTYLKWCEHWADECVRLLKPGGSFFIWNLPKWNQYLASYLSHRLTFRHWIAVDIKYSLPISGRLYPSHYSLLYFCKGPKPSKFHPDRLPMEICPKCLADLKDYGGYKNKMNPKGVNISDVWLGIPPVRHAKYKKRNGSNELSIKLLDRVIEMASDEGDLVFDPFGGSGSTYAVAEIKNRRWIGIELGPEEEIVQRFCEIENDRQHLKKIREGYNRLFTVENKIKREKVGLWTDDTVQQKGKRHRQLKLV